MLQHLYTLTPPTDDDVDPETDAAVDATVEAAAPATLGSWHVSVAAGGRRLGLVSGNLVEVVDTTRPTVWPTCRFRLDAPPAGASQIAVHPSGEAIVVAEQGTLRPASRNLGDPSFSVSLPAEWGSPRAISFDRTGRVLWASFSDQGKHHLWALDWATLALVGSATLEGLADADHQLFFHPEQTDVIVVAQMAHDRASRVQVIENDGGQLRVLDRGLPVAARHSTEPLFFAGFSASGDRAATVSARRIEQWSWSDGSSLGSRELHDEMSFRPTGCYVGQRLVALLHARPDDSDRVAVFDERLALDTNFAHRSVDTDDAIVGITPLAEDRLLLVGTRRAGLFRLADGEREEDRSEG